MEKAPAFTKILLFPFPTWLKIIINDKFFQAQYENEKFKVNSNNNNKNKIVDFEIANIVLHLHLSARIFSP